jgi:hypothetical protein
LSSLGSASFATSLIKTARTLALAFGALVAALTTALAGLFIIQVTARSLLTLLTFTGLAANIFFLSRIIGLVFWHMYPLHVVDRVSG